MKLELIFAGKYNGKSLFTKRANDGMFFSVPDNEQTNQLVESGVYELEFETDFAYPRLNSLADVESLLVLGLLTKDTTPKFLRTVSGKPLHFDVKERFAQLLTWIDSINN